MNPEFLKLHLKDVYLSPLEAFLDGPAHTPASSELTFDSEAGEYVCTRTPTDAVEQIIEEIVPAGTARYKLLAAVWDRVRATQQKATLADKSAYYAARDVQLRRNMNSLIGGLVRTHTEDTCTELALAGIMEAAGAISGGHFSPQEVKAVSAALARTCYTASSPTEFVHSIAGMVKPRQLDKLRAAGFRL